MDGIDYSIVCSRESVPDATKSDNALIHFLSLLLTNEMPLESRKQRLEDEYKVQMNESLEKEMSTMCNLGESIARTSRAEGLTEGLAKGHAEGLAKGLAKGHAEGRAEGRAEGLDEGLKIIAGMVKDNLVSMSEAAKRANLSLEEFSKKTGIPIPQ